MFSENFLVGCLLGKDVFHRLTSAKRLIVQSLHGVGRIGAYTIYIPRRCTWIRQISRDRGGINLMPNKSIIESVAYWRIR
jgi:hypothetical protein